MSSFSEYQKKRILMEFNGPVGQPDPSGVSSPSLKPRFPSLSKPTMGTQPGMSMQLPDSDPYQEFVNYLAGLNTIDHIEDVIQRLEQDVAKIIQSRS